MKIKKLIVSAILITAMLAAFTACSNSQSKAKTALKEYLQCIVDKDYEAAYEYLCDFDRDNISKELFVNWRTDIAKIQTLKSFTLSGKVDKFKNYKYLGTTLGNTFGFEVSSEFEKIVEDMSPGGYDAKSYHIMVVSDGDDCKVALLLTDLDEVVGRLNSQLAAKEKSSQ